MSLRRNPKRRSARGALMSAVTLMSPAGRVAKGLAAANGVRSLRKRRRGRPVSRPPMGILAAVALAGGVGALLRRRRARRIEADYGPPNESVPSHETLAPSVEAAKESEAATPAS